MPFPIMFADQIATPGSATEGNQIAMLLLTGLLLPGFALFVRWANQKIDEMKAASAKREEDRKLERAEQHAETMAALQQNHATLTQIAEHHIATRGADLSALLDEALTESDPESPRGVMYGEIKKIVQDGPDEYYRAHPERAGDQRSLDAHQASKKGVDAIFDVLDQYDGFNFGPTHPLYKVDTTAAPAAADSPPRENEQPE